MIAATVSTHETMGNVKIMFSSLSAYGHLYPMMPLAFACAAAGARDRDRRRATVSGPFAAANRSRISAGYAAGLGNPGGQATPS
jgi:hypothetical protein